MHDAIIVGGSYAGVSAGLQLARALATCWFWTPGSDATAGRRLRTASWVRTDRTSGKWMYHCHILEHHAAGMMGHFEVVRP